jgi:TetR/AcrR family transcriptional regulator
MTVQINHSLEDRKQVFLKAAEGLFAQHGFERTSIRMIAGALNVNSAMISYYFGSKEALYLQIFRNRLVAITDEIKKFENLDLDPPKKLETYLLSYIKRISSDQIFHRLLYTQLATRQHPEVISLVTKARTEIFSFLLKVVKSGIKTRQFNLIDEQIFVLNILAFIPSVFTGNLNSLLHLDKHVSEDISERMIGHIMTMVIPAGLQSKKTYDV